MANTQNETARPFNFTRGQRVHVKNAGGDYAAIFRRWDGGLAVVRVLDPEAAAAADPDYPTHLDLGLSGVITIDPNFLTEDQTCDRPTNADPFAPSFIPAGTVGHASSLHDCREVELEHCWTVGEERSARDYLAKNSREHSIDPADTIRDSWVYRRSIVVRSESERYGSQLFLVRLIMPGDRYGADRGFGWLQKEHPDLDADQMVKINDNQEPLIEFNEVTNNDTWPRHAKFGPLGQFTGGRYMLSTMRERYQAGHGGLNLDGAVPRWSIDSGAFRAAYEALVIMQGLDGSWLPSRDAVDNSMDETGYRWRHVNRINSAADLPWHPPADIREILDTCTNVVTRREILPAIRCILSGGVMGGNLNERAARFGFVYFDHLKKEYRPTFHGWLWAFGTLQNLPDLAVVMEGAEQRVNEALEAYDGQLTGRANAQQQQTINGRILFYTQVKQYIQRQGQE